MNLKPITKRFIIMLIAVGSAGCSSTTRSTDWQQRSRQIKEDRIAIAKAHKQTNPNNTQKVQGQIWNDKGSGRETYLITESQGLQRQHDAQPSSDHPFRLVADEPTITEPEQQENQRGAISEEVPEIERGPLPGFFETVKRDIKQAPGLLWHDTKKSFGNPYNLVFLLGAGGVSGALRPEVDDDIEDYYDKHHSFKEDWRDAFGAAGNPATHFALAGAWYLVGQQAQDAKTYEVGKRMFSALGITGLSTMLLKVAANTESPNGEMLGWPSGHVSSTMAMATVLNDAYGPLVGVPMYGLTALVGAERLDSGEHHFSDLIFGAALGWVVAETVMKEHQPEIFGGQIVPYIDPINQHSGLAWVKPLDP